MEQSTDIAAEENNSRIRRVIALVFMAAAVLCIGLSFWLQQRSHQQQMAPIKEALAQHADYKKDNGAIAATGLFLTESFGIDTYGTILNLVEKNTKVIEDRRQAIKNNAKDPYKDLVGYYDLVPSQSLQNAVEKMGQTLDFKGDHRSISCDFGVCPKKAFDAADKNIIGQMESDNKLLLQRYEKMLTYPHFVQLPFFQSGKSQVLINTNRLYFSRAVLLAEKDPEAAAQQWLAAARFIKRSLADENSMVHRAILLLMYSACQKSFPMIFDKTEIVQKHRDELLGFLTPFGPQEMKIPNMLKGEEATWNTVSFLFSTRTKDQFYDWAKEYHALSQLPAPIFARQRGLMEQKNKTALKRYWWPITDWLDIRASITANLLLGGMRRGTELIEAMHNVNVYTSLLHYYVRAKSQDISPVLIAQKSADPSLRPAERASELSNWMAGHDLIFHPVYNPVTEDISFDAAQNAFRYTNSANGRQYYILY